MPPKQVKGRSAAPEPNYARTVVQTFTSAENRSVVSAIALFAVGVTFLHSSWSEILLPA